MQYYKGFRSFRYVYYLFLCVVQEKAYEQLKNANGGGDGGHAIKGPATLAPVDDESFTDGVIVWTSELTKPFNVHR